MSTKLKHNKKQIIYTIAAIALLSGMIFGIISYVYIFAEQEAFVNLDYQSNQIKDTIDLQIMSDRENLQTMANFAAKLYSDNEGYDILLNSFKKIGLIENIGILTPDNRFHSKAGIYDVSQHLDFEEESKKGVYISNLVTDLNNPEVNIIRSAVPIVSNGKVVAMLYGALNPKEMEKIYGEMAHQNDSELYLIEASGGQIMVDSLHSKVGSITSLATVKYRDGFSYSKFLSEFTGGMHGYTVYISATLNEYVYAHYEAFDFAPWRLMLTKPERLVFANAYSTGSFLGMMFAAVIFVMGLYLFAMIYESRKKHKINSFSSSIRKNLIEMGRNTKNIENALAKIVQFSRSRSAFFVDANGQNYDSIKNTNSRYILRGDEREYFTRKLISYVTKQKKDLGVSIQLITLYTDKKLLREMPEFYTFLKKHDIKKVQYAGIVEENNISLIVVINPQSGYVDMLLHDIAICFSMAVYNQNHMIHTEDMALSDSLTSVSNRMAYTNDIKSLESMEYDTLTFVYIDVNELHFFNNKYGHAAGDQMLMFIAEVLSEEFAGSKIYRMGGDEFVIFVFDTNESQVRETLKTAKERIEEMKYHISIGVCTCPKNSPPEDAFSKAEAEMYDDKVGYYQTKHSFSLSGHADNHIESAHTGMSEIDACLSVIKNHYPGVYCVSTQTDIAIPVLAPAIYFGMDPKTTPFSEVLASYVHNCIKPEFHRTILSMTNYATLRQHLNEAGETDIAYERNDGTKIILRIHPISDSTNGQYDTVWTFEIREE